MSARERFGPNLRRIREQRGVSLEQLADRTNVDIELWDAMERNDFSRWPAGIFARAFVREYARTVGIDPESTVDEFCRCFPQGDRRRGRILRAEAQLLGLDSEWHDDLGSTLDDRRRVPDTLPPSEAARDALLVRRSRIAATACDIVMACGTGALLASATGARVLPVLGAVTLAYHSAGVIFLGATPGSALVAAWLRHSASAGLRRVSPLAFPRLRRHLRTARS
jgi:hypothetical protein